MTTQQERQKWVVEATTYLRERAYIPRPPRDKLRERTQARNKPLKAGQ